MCSTHFSDDHRVVNVTATPLASNDSIDFGNLSGIHVHHEVEMLHYRQRINRAVRIQTICIKLNNVCCVQWGDGGSAPSEYAHGYDEQFVRLPEMF